jgi:hypothetical protein
MWAPAGILLNRLLKLLTASAGAIRGGEPRLYLGDQHESQSKVDAKALTSARSVTTKIYNRESGGGEHCQLGVPLSERRSDRLVIGEVREWTLSRAFAFHPSLLVKRMKRKGRKIKTLSLHD